MGKHGELIKHMMLCVWGNTRNTTIIHLKDSKRKYKILRTYKLQYSEGIRGNTTIISVILWGTPLQWEYKY